MAKNKKTNRQMIVEKTQHRELKNVWCWHYLSELWIHTHRTISSVKLVDMIEYFIIEKVSMHQNT